MQKVRPTANGVAFLVLGSDGLWEGVPDSKVSRAGLLKYWQEINSVPLKNTEAYI